MRPVVYSRRARRELLGIWNYLADYSETAADRMVAKIDGAIQVLGDFPEIGQTREDLGLACRSIPVKPYIIFYRVLSDRVEVSRILHGARDLKSELRSIEEDEP